MTDASGDVVYVNDAALTLTGWRRSEVLGRGVDELFEDDTLTLEHLRLHDEASPCPSGRARLSAVAHATDDATKRVHCRVSSISEGEPSGGFIIAMAPSSPGLTSEELRELVDDGDIMGAVNSAVVVTGLDGCVEYINRFAEEFFGYTYDEVRGRPLVGTIVPSTESTGRDLSHIITDVCADPESFKTYENENMTKDGRRVWMVWTNRAIHGPDGRCARILSVGSDITRTRMAEEALREAHQELEERVRQRTADLLNVNQQLENEIAYRKRTEGALRVQRDRLEAVARSIGAGLSILSTDYRVVWTNAVARDTFGNVEGEVLVDTCADESNQCPHCLARRVFEEGLESVSGEQMTWDQSEGTVWSEFRVTPMEDEQGQVDGVLIVQTPITDRKRAEHEFRLAEIEKRTILDAIPEHVIYHDTEMSIKWANEAAAASIGMRPEDMVGRRCHELWQERPYPCVGCPVVATLRDSQPHVAEMRSPDGRVWMVRSNPVGDDDGHTIGVVEVTDDITEQKRSANALEESERRLSTLLANMPGMAYRCPNTPEWPMEFVSEGALALTGYDADELTGSPSVPYVSLIHLEDREDVWRGVQDGLSRDGAFQLAYRLITASGEEKWVWEQGRGVYSPDEELVALEGIIIDATDRRRAADAQRMAAVGQLAAGVAHEFNNILASMMLAAELTVQRGDQDDTEQLSDIVLRAATRGAEICRSLTSFARPKPQRLQPMAIEDAIEGALAMAAPQIGGFDVVVHRDFGTEGALVYADANQLEQVFLNLVINAYQAMPEGGTLTLVTRCHQSQSGRREVIARVVDTGQGISPEDQPRVFEPFFTTKGRLGESDVPGTGLGLSVSHGIITSHGGDISVSSRAGAGTTIEIRLKTHETSHAEMSAGQQPQAAEAGDVRRLSVLLAEDDDDLRALVTGVLDMYDCSVTGARTAAEALRALRDISHDIVITDLLMPGGGRTVLSALSDMPASPPVLVITGKADEVSVEVLETAGRGALLRKPFGIAELTRAIQQLLGPGRTEQAP